MKPVVVAAAVASVLVLAQLVLFAGVRTALPVLPAPGPGGRPFLIEQIPDGTTLSQLLNVRGADLDTLELESSLAAPAQSGAIDATLVELTGDNAGREVRTVSVRVIDSCCTFKFEPIRDSAGGRYRLDLKIRDFGASAPVSLWAVPLEHVGRLTVNGRPQAARLAFNGYAAGDTALSRLQNSAPQRNLSLGGLLALLLVLDTAVAFGAALLTKEFTTSG